jgi:hypothetical protein
MFPAAAFLDVVGKESLPLKMADFSRQKDDTGVSCDNQVLGT